jgi:hypothetical protein
MLLGALTRGETMTVAALCGGLAAALTTIVLLSVDNHTLINQHTRDIVEFGQAARVVERFGAGIESALRLIFAKLGIPYPSG